MSVNEQIIYGPLTVIDNLRNDSDTYATVSLATMIRSCTCDGRDGLNALYRIRCSSDISFDEIKLSEVILNSQIKRAK